MPTDSIVMFSTTSDERLFIATYFLAPLLTRQGGVSITVRYPCTDQRMKDPRVFKMDFWLSYHLFGDNFYLVGVNNTKIPIFKRNTTSKTQRVLLHFELQTPRTSYSLLRLLTDLVTL